MTADRTKMEGTRSAAKDYVGVQTAPPYVALK